MKATQLAFTCSKSTTKMPERHHKLKSFVTVVNSFKPLTVLTKLFILWLRSCVFVVNYEQISCTDLLFPLLTLNKDMSSWYFNKVILLIRKTVINSVNSVSNKSHTIEIKSVYTFFIKHFGQHRVSVLWQCISRKIAQRARVS